VQRCLDMIEADSQLSDASVEAVTQAKQHINSCLQAHSAASDAVSSWTWLQRQSDTQLTDSHVCILHQSSSDNIDNEMMMSTAVWQMLLPLFSNRQGLSSGKYGWEDFQSSSVQVGCVAQL